MSDLSKLHAVVKTIVEEAGRPVLRTQLVKLVYLADREFAREQGRQLTDCHYTSYYYGPYSDEIVAAAHELNGIEVQEEAGLSATGNSYYLYRPGPCRRTGFPDLDPVEHTVVSDTVQKFVGKNLQDLLDVVYATPEFERTERGGEIVLA